jgi:hypothetical protein
MMVFMLMTMFMFLMIMLMMMSFLPFLFPVDLHGHGGSMDPAFHSLHCADGDTRDPQRRYFL